MTISHLKAFDCRPIIQGVATFAPDVACVTPLSDDVTAGDEPAPVSSAPRNCVRNPANSEFEILRPCRRPASA